MTDLVDYEQLGNIALITMGQSPAPGSCDDDERGMPFLQGCAEFGNQHPESKSFCHTPLKIAKASSTLISVRAPVGTTNRAERDYCIGRGLAAILARGVTENNDFLQYAVEQNVGFLHRRSQGSTFLAISSRDLHQMEVPHPQRVVQDKIADILLTIDGAIHHTDALIEKHKQIKTGLMHDLFTRGLDASGHLRPPREEAPQLYKESPLGWLPKEWTTTTLEACAEVDRGMFTARPRNDPKYYGGTSPFIQTGDVTASIGRILVSYSQTLNKHGRLISKSFPAGSIMITIAANIADTCILGIPMFAPDSLVGAAPKSGQDSRFLELSIRTRKQFLSSRAPQSAQKNINLQDLRPLMLPRPSSQEQMRISERYEAADASLQSLEAERTKLLFLKQGLMNDLLTGEVPINHCLSASEPAHV
jgi:type I restriction enzyme S subunit